MKKTILLILFFLPNLISAQVYCGYIAGVNEMYFENASPYLDYHYKLEMDTFSNPNNIWQVGKPSKFIIDSSYSYPNSIVTDTLNPYPVNDTSVFIIKHPDNGGFSHQHSAEFAGYYIVNSDSLNDFGLFEFSPDNGDTWIDLINDTIYDDYIEWFSPKPVLTGNSDGWQNFWVWLPRLGEVFEINMFDTVIFKITWISDEIKDTLDGLALDNLEFCDGVESIYESGFNNFDSKLYPNPSCTDITIEFKNDISESFQLATFNSKGELIEQIDGILDGQIMINTNSYSSGLYYYRLLNNKKTLRSSGKFAINK